MPWRVGCCNFSACAWHSTFSRRPLRVFTLAYGKARYSAIANGTRVTLMVSGIFFAIRMYGIREAIFLLVIAQAFSYFPLIYGLKKFLPEVAGTELRWYGLFLIFLRYDGTVHDELCRCALKRP